LAHFGRAQNWSVRILASGVQGCSLMHLIRCRFNTIVITCRISLNNHADAYSVGRITPHSRGSDAISSRVVYRGCCTGSLARPAAAGRSKDLGTLRPTIVYHMSATNSLLALVTSLFCPVCTRTSCWASAFYGPVDSTHPNGKN
jgi:hypothetical protein